MAKMRKKKLLTRKKSSSPDWYNFFFKPLADLEFQAQLQLSVDRWLEYTEYSTKMITPSQAREGVYAS